MRAAPSAARALLPLKLLLMRLTAFDHCPDASPLGQGRSGTIAGTTLGIQMATTKCVTGGRSASLSILAHLLTFDYILTRRLLYAVLIDEALFHQTGSVVHLAAWWSQCLARASPRILPARLTAQAGIIITSIDREVIERTRVHLEDAVVGATLLI